jgi:hypothetical protein
MQNEKFIAVPVARIGSGQCQSINSSISYKKRSACICAGDWTTIDDEGAVSASSLWEEIYFLFLFALELAVILVLLVLNRFYLQNAVLDSEQNLPEYPAIQALNVILQGNPAKLSIIARQ